MRRFNLQELHEYWKVYASRWSGLDHERDPDGLGNACHAGAPLWLNTYYARYQRITYQKLFDLVPSPKSITPRALDVGCGAGRWCRFLTQHGYKAVGLELQRELVEINRVRFPEIEFVCSAIEDYVTTEVFDLISSVTVIQHIPHDVQEPVIEKLRGFLRLGGHAIILENVRDQGPHVFSNTIGDWQAKFHKAGFMTVAIQRYDYNPLLRFLSGASLLYRPRNDEIELRPTAFAEEIGREDGWVRSAYRLSQRVAIVLDNALERFLVRENMNLPSIHCGFLFRAV